MFTAAEILDSNGGSVRVNVRAACRMWSFLGVHTG